MTTEAERKNDLGIYRVHKNTWPSWRGKVGSYNPRVTGYNKVKSDYIQRIERMNSVVFNGGNPIINGPRRFDEGKYIYSDSKGDIVIYAKSFFVSKSSYSYRDNTSKHLKDVRNYGSIRITTNKWDEYNIRSFPYFYNKNGKDYIAVVISSDVEIEIKRDVVSYGINENNSIVNPNEEPTLENHYKINLTNALPYLYILEKDYSNCDGESSEGIFGEDDIIRKVIPLVDSIGYPSVQYDTIIQHFASSTDDEAFGGYDRDISTWFGLSSTGFNRICDPDAGEFIFDKCKDLWKKMGYSTDFTTSIMCSPFGSKLTYGWEYLNSTINSIFFNTYGDYGHTIGYIDYTDNNNNGGLWYLKLLNSDVCKYCSGIKISVIKNKSYYTTGTAEHPDFEVKAQDLEPDIIHTQTNMESTHSGIPFVISVPIIPIAPSRNEHEYMIYAGAYELGKRYFDKYYSGSGDFAFTSGKHSGKDCPRIFTALLLASDDADNAVVINSEFVNVTYEKLNSVPYIDEYIESSNEALITSGGNGGNLCLNIVTSRFNSDFFSFSQLALVYKRVIRTGEVILEVSDIRPWTGVTSSNVMVKDYFGNKQSLITKFAQIGAMPNCMQSSAETVDNKHYFWCSNANLAYDCISLFNLFKYEKMGENERTGEGNYANAVILSTSGLAYQPSGNGTDGPYNGFCITDTIERSIEVINDKETVPGRLTYPKTPSRTSANNTEMSSAFESTSKPAQGITALPEDISIIYLGSFSWQFDIFGMYYPMMDRDKITSKTDVAGTSISKDFLSTSRFTYIIRDIYSSEQNYVITASSVSDLFEKIGSAYKFKNIYGLEGPVGDMTTAEYNSMIEKDTKCRNLMTCLSYNTTRDGSSANLNRRYTASGVAIHGIKDNSVLFSYADGSYDEAQWWYSRYIYTGEFTGSDIITYSRLFENDDNGKRTMSRPIVCCNDFAIIFRTAAKVSYSDIRVENIYLYDLEKKKLYNYFEDDIKNEADKYKRTRLYFADNEGIPRFVYSRNESKRFENRFVVIPANNTKEKSKYGIYISATDGFNLLRYIPNPLVYDGVPLDLFQYKDGKTGELILPKHREL